MRLLPVLIMLCLASPAWAGERAVYQMEDGKKMTVEVADDGNSVVRPEGQDQYGIWRDGHFYLVSREEGAWKVARIEDIAAALDQVLPPIFKKLFGAAAEKGNPKSKLTFVPRGMRTIAGHAGRVYAVTGLDETKPKAVSEFVMTDEPALQPVGKAVEEFVVGTTVLMAPLIGQVAAEMASDTRVIFTRGAPLDMGGRFKLLSFEQVAIPASAAALPAPPQTLDQILKEVKTSSPPETKKAE